MTTYAPTILEWADVDPDTLARIEREADAGGDIFALVEVAAPCTEDEPCFPNEPTYCQERGCDGEPSGWAVLYRNAGE